MRIILFLSLLCTGIYYEYQSCFLSIAFLYMLWRTARKNGALIWRKNYPALFFPALSMLYLLSAIWAVDSHMALLGSLKILPVGLCALLFMLICLLYLLHQKEMRGVTIAQAIVLLAGILLTGSRTVFLMLPVAMLASGVMLHEKRRKALCFGLVGVGYLGYYFTQGGFQTGVYAVTHVHNEFLQVFLDVGWLAGVGFLGVWLYGLWLADCGWKRLLLMVMGAHALVDFDLQYMAVYMVFLTLLPWERGGQRQASLKRIKGITIIFACLSLALCYFGIGNGAYYFKAQSFAARFYPQNTLLQIEELKAAEDTAAMEEWADKILAHNDAVALAWGAKARAAFEKDLEGMETAGGKMEAAKTKAVEDVSDWKLSAYDKAGKAKIKKLMETYREKIESTVSTGEIEKLVKQFRSAAGKVMTRAEKEEQKRLEEEKKKQEDEQTAAPPKTASKSAAQQFVGGSAEAMAAAIGQPASKSYSASCLGPGQDGVWYYSGFTVYTYKEGGSETVMSVE